MPRIPKFKSDKEAAEYWDTHDLTDHLDELKPTDELVFVRPEKQIVSFRI